MRILKVNNTKGGETVKRFLRLSIPLILSLTMLIGFGMPVEAATTADVAVSATPEYLSISNNLASWAIGAVAASDANAYWWDADGNGYQAKGAEPFVDGWMPATITNGGSVTSDIEVKVTSTAWAGGVGWTVAGAVGADTVVVKAGITGTANEAAMVTLTDANQDLKTSLAASGTIKWVLHLETGTFTDGVEKTGTVRLTITKS